MGHFLTSMLATRSLASNCERTPVNTPKQTGNSAQNWSEHQSKQGRNHAYPAKVKVQITVEDAVSLSRIQMLWSGQPLPSILQKVTHPDQFLIDQRTSRGHHAIDYMSVSFFILSQ